MAETTQIQRKLAAILAADIVGYSRLMGADEEGTLARLKALRAELIDPTVAEHRGRIVKTTGDGLLVEFASVVDAVRCAVAWREGMRGRDAGSIAWRIGINLGDVIADGDDIFGDGVNIAARLEALAEPGGICVSRTVITQTRGKLDLPVADLGEQALKNIAQPVHVFRILAEEKKMPEPSLPLPDKPSIAVLPFQNMSGDPEQEYFADGMVEEIITALSRIRWLFVIARNSTFTYKGQAIDVKQIGRELGVRYVLEGSVRKGGGRVRITAQLIEAETGAHLWADRFDGSLEDVFDLQDQVATSVAGVIEPALEVAEIRRSTSRATSDLTAYDLYLRALPHWGSFERTEIDEALNLLEQAIERDPQYGLALSAAAVCHMHRMLNWAEDQEAERREGVDQAQRALHVAGEDPGVLINAAIALATLGEEIGTVLPLIDRALVLNPNFGRGWYARGMLKIRDGEADAGLDDVKTSMRLNPRDRFGAHLLALGAGHFACRRFEEAATHLRLAIQERPRWPTPCRLLAACLAQMGRLEEAREIAHRLPTIARRPMGMAEFFRNPEHRELFMSGLRLATGEEPDT